MTNDFQLHNYGPRGVCIPAGEHSVECAHRYLGLWEVVFLDGVAQNAPTVNEIREQVAPVKHANRNVKINALVAVLDKMSLLFPGCSYGYYDETERYVAELSNPQVIDLIDFSLKELYNAKDLVPEIVNENQSIMVVDIVPSGPYIEPCMKISFYGTKIVVEINKKELPL